MSDWKKMALFADDNNSDDSYEYEITPLEDTK